MRTRYPAVVLYFLICLSPAFAQHAPRVVPGLQNHQRVLQVLLNERCTACRSNAASFSSVLTLERTVGQSTRDNVQNTIVDSVLLTYGANGSSAFDYNMMLYAYNYPCNNSPVFDYLGNFSAPKVLFHTYKRWTIDPNTLNYGPYEDDFITYDANNNMLGDTVLFADSAFYPNRIFHNLYNSGSKLKAAFGSNWSGGMADSTTRKYFSYDVYNRLSKDSEYVYAAAAWHLRSKTFYTYNASNDLVKIDQYANPSDTTFTHPLIKQLMYDNSYDVNGRLKTVLTSYYNGTALVPYVKDTFAYTPGVSFHTSWKEYQYDPINTYWAPITYMHKLLNTFGLPDTVYVFAFDSLANKWVPASRSKIFYNSYNDPVKMDEYDYNFSYFPLTPDLTTKYYYQPYSITTVVDQNIFADDKERVYPNPFREEFSIDLSSLRTNAGDKVLLQLFDVLGNKTADLSLQGGDKMNVHADLAPGPYLYVLLLNGDKIRSGKLIALPK